MRTEKKSQASQLFPESMPTPKPAPWGVGGGIIMLLIAMGILPLLLTMGTQQFLPRLEKPQLFALLQINTLIGWGTVIAYLHKQYPSQWQEALGISFQEKRTPRFWFRETLLALFGILVIVSLLSLATAFFYPSEPVPSPYQPMTTETLKQLAIFGILTAPITEELTFRGFVQSTLYRYSPPRWAMLLTAILFTGAHTFYIQYPVALLYVFLLGLWLSYMRLRTGSIIPGTLAHLFNNLLAAIQHVGPLVFPTLFQSTG